jgi:hypothetical protein
MEISRDIEETYLNTVHQLNEEIEGLYQATRMYRRESCLWRRGCYKLCSLMEKINDRFRKPAKYVENGDRETSLQTK